MGFDRPGMLGSGSDERNGGSMIDAESLSLLRKMYPTLGNVSNDGFMCSQTNGWKEVIGGGRCICNESLPNK